MAVWPYSTANWQRLRLRKLSEQPLCEVCTKLGRIVPASHVDHRIAIAKGGEAFPPLEGLAALCASCHSRKTNAEDNPHAFGFGPAKGCDPSGAPLDDTHPWGASNHEKPLV
ncbi:HNH endonuclease signature motif containing protein [Glycocaulis alkaliphilus]|uniref:HNH endonuclease signature motif containing protein n=1 Tax=Glycocaulis alkaliphilus TaxID=1434191 RepID=UPI000FD94390|nr:HNH endonuclease signature motif containing protein [Glycocaulis alkaliphilus]GGB70648.1 hypothetical protein GCM10007417_08040 [Glycocaulis alkaliphilus]